MKLSYFSALAFVTSVVGQSTVLHPNGNVNKCLDVRGDIRANGTAVQMYARCPSIGLIDELTLMLALIATAHPHNSGN